MTYALGTAGQRQIRRIPEGILFAAIIVLVAIGLKYDLLSRLAPAPIGYYYCGYKDKPGAMPGSLLAAPTELQPGQANQVRAA